MKLTDKRINELLGYFEKHVGNPSDETVQGVQEAHGGVDQMKEMAQLWAQHHNAFFVSDAEQFVAYATAVDLGYRMAKSMRREA